MILLQSKIEFTEKKLLDQKTDSFTSQTRVFFIECLYGI